MEFKLYKCSHCGNVALKLVNSGVPMVCCGEKMSELIPGSTDGALEKHVPVITRDGDRVTVQVGSVLHPMLPEHWIHVIAAVGEDTVTIRLPKAGDTPILNTVMDGNVIAYELCNLHGFWKGN
jgi:superoxide reductase